MIQEQDQVLGAPFGTGSREPSPTVSALSGFDPSRCAVLSDCGTYRYRLERQCPGDGQTTVIMVNPSTADGQQDDATIRKLLGFGRRNNWGRLVVGNLFAYRATDVRLLGKAADPIGPLNDSYLMDMLREADRVVFAWGPVAKQPRRLRDRYKRIAQLARFVSRRPLSIGGPAKDGHPRHPLMLPYSVELVEWRDPASAIEARRAETAKTGSVHESAVPKADAQPEVSGGSHG